MGHADLADAWRHLKRLESLFANNPGGRQQTAVLAAVRRRCAALAGAVRDVVVHDRLAELEMFAADLFSASAHHKWSRQEVTGAEWLRFQIYRTFNSLDTRLRMLRQVREATPTPSAVAAHEAAPEP